MLEDDSQLEVEEDVNDDGRPSTSTTLMEIVMENPGITSKEVAGYAGRLIGSCTIIFSDIFGMKRVPAKFDLKMRNVDEKNPTHEHRSGAVKSCQLFYRSVPKRHDW